jgi:hypothetical protein
LSNFGFLRTSFGQGKSKKPSPRISTGQRLAITCGHFMFGDGGQPEHNRARAMPIALARAARWSGSDGIESSMVRPFANGM